MNVFPGPDVVRNAWELKSRRCLRAIESPCHHNFSSSLFYLSHQVQNRQLGRTLDLVSLSSARMGGTSPRHRPFWPPLIYTRRKFPLVRIGVETFRPNPWTSYPRSLTNLGNYVVVLTPFIIFSRRHEPCLGNLAYRRSRQRIEEAASWPFHRPTPYPHALSGCSYAPVIGNIVGLAGGVTGPPFWCLSFY